jgi:CHAT domain-containing protein/tetratricopeptide (TPR) repeat protein
MSRPLFVALTLPVVCVCLATVEAGLHKEEPKASQARETPAAQEPGPALTLSERQQRLRERDRYGQEAAKLAAAGKLAEAVAAAEKMLTLERQLFGDVHEEVADSLQWIAQLQEQREDFAAARQACREVLTIRRKLDGPEHWRVTDARRALEDVERRSRMTPAQRQRLGEASRLNGEVVALYGRGKFREAVQAAQQALAIRKEVLGERHPDYAQSLHNLAGLYQAVGDYGKAEPLFRQALAITKEALGDKHPLYATGLYSLAVLYQQMGDYAQAEPLCRRALAIRKEALGDKHPLYATSLHNLAHLYQEMGDYAQAGPLCRQALAIHKQALGDKHPSYAQSLNSLALLYEAMGDFAQAEPLHRRALAIRKEALGDKHPDYATSLNNLAHLYQEMGDFAQAEPLHRRALAIRKEALGDKHPLYAQSLDNLAGLYQEMGDYAKAEPLHRQALAIRKEALGEKHPDYAAGLNNLALLYRAMGDYAQAEPLHRQALAITKEALGDKHPDYATSLHNLALLYQSMGDNAKAEPLYRRALAIRKEALGDKHPDYANSLSNLSLLSWAVADYAQAERFLRQGLKISRDNLDLAAAAQSERQQLAMTSQLRVALDAYLTLATLAKRAREAAYSHVLAWKGAVLARQRRLRLQRSHPELADAFAQLDRVAGRLAALAFAVPDPKQQEAFRRQIQELSEQKERLESDLARRSAAFRQEREAERLTPDRLQAVLPPDAVLVDFLEYTHGSPPAQGKGKWQVERRLAAFVVRRDSIEQLDLGPAQPFAETIDRWRRTTKWDRPIRDEIDPGGELRKRLWLPLEPRLRGARVVLVSPDGALTRLPLAALPGNKPDTYLLEEVSLAVVPVPQLLPELLALGKADAKAEPSVLLVGDVDFGAAPGLADARGSNRTAIRGNRAGVLMQFNRLEATHEEIRAVADSFRRGHRTQTTLVTELRDDKATEAAVRGQACKHRYLHFATHGFFAPPELRSVLAPAPTRENGPAEAGRRGPDLFGRHGVSGFHPGLLSGLVLAGANRPAGAGADDGILTALEVAELDLSGVELAALSACETGLGETAGGEGLLGLQRAFQTAGARSVVASLWQVPDHATRALMERFYENLWHKRMGRLASLREAQLWMLREGAKQPDVLRGVQRRLPKESRETTDGKLPPYFWAAFVLSGDWR